MTIPTTLAEAVAELKRITDVLELLTAQDPERDEDHARTNDTGAG